MKITRQEMDGFHIERVDPDLGRVSDIDRFRRNIPDIEEAGTDKCWIWRGKKTGRGYPVFWDSNISEWTTAARWACDHLLSPPVLAYQRVQRTCGNRSCVNPFHARFSAR